MNASAKREVGREKLDARVRYIGIASNEDTEDIILLGTVTNPIQKIMPNQIKTAITNVRVFDGAQLSPPTTVVIEGDSIGTDDSAANKIDGEGGVLLPGLIDAHVHLTKLEDLRRLAKAGITTAMDMACWPPDLVNSLRNLRGLTDIRSAGTPLTSPGSAHSHIPNMPKDALISDTKQARNIVARRIAEGSDYIKLIADVPGPPQDVLNAAAAEAKTLGKFVVAHASTYVPVQMAQEAKVDMLTHAPLDAPVTQLDAEMMVRESRTCIPTLVMMEGVARLKRPGTDYAHSEQSVRAMHKAGVTIVAGTDANDTPGSPSPISHGDSLHRELELLVESGLSTVDALRSATVISANQFGLHDRGVIEPGRRADLVLIGGNPIQDIRNTRLIRRVWCAGVEVTSDGHASS